MPGRNAIFLKEFSPSKHLSKWDQTGREREETQRHNLLGRLKCLWDRSHADFGSDSKQCFPRSSLIQRKACHLRPYPFRKTYFQRHQGEGCQIGSPICYLRSIGLTTLSSIRSIAGSRIRISKPITTPFAFIPYTAMRNFPFSLVKRIRGCHFLPSLRGMTALTQRASSLSPGNCIA